MLVAAAQFAAGVGSAVSKMGLVPLEYPTLMQSIITASVGEYTS